MKKEKVLLKDFGKRMNDTENRDEKLKAYICAILDVPETQFFDVLKRVKTSKDKEAFVNMIFTDTEGRVERFINEVE